jgi:Leucine-rich repeat (LRR) protein
MNDLITDILTFSTVKHKFRVSKSMLDLVEDCGDIIRTVDNITGPQATSIPFNLNCLITKRTLHTFTDVTNVKRAILTGRMKSTALKLFPSSLEHLEINKVHTFDIEHLQHIKGLKHLDLILMGGYFKINTLEKVENLEVFHLKRCELLNSNFYSTMNKLKILKLSEMSIENNVFQLTQFPELHTLILDNVYFGHMIKNVPKLTTLVIVNSSIRDEDLYELTTLTHLYFTGTFNITDDLYQHLPNLKVFILN